MKNQPDCLPCCLRRVLHAANLVTDDTWLHRKILAESMQELSRADDLASPAEVIHGVGRRAARALGVAAPYAAERKRWLEATLSQEDRIRRAIDEAEDPFLEAVKFSVAANLVDCEFRDEIQPGFSVKSIREEVPRLGLSADNIEDLRQAVADSARILFIHETAGELLFDRLLIETMGKPLENVASVVRESPSLASALAEDAAAVGLDRVARIIDPGIACRGIPLSACSKEFQAEYGQADLVVAKGQAAFETLEGAGSEIDGVRKHTFFLLRVKCSVVARQLGVRVGDCVVEQN